MIYDEEGLTEILVCLPVSLASWDTQGVGALVSPYGQWNHSANILAVFKLYLIVLLAGATSNYG